MQTPTPAGVILFEDGTLGEHVKSAVHLVSIDEKRIVFQPTLFNYDKKRVEEVWFAGVHSDVGGGYWFDGLSDITLQFMCNRAEGAGLEILPMNKVDYGSPEDLSKKIDAGEAICRDDIEIRPFIKGVMHEQKRAGRLIKTLAPRLVRVDENDKESENYLPIIHHTICDRFNKVTGYRPYALHNRKYKVLDKNGDIGEERLGIVGLRQEISSRKPNPQQQ